MATITQAYRFALDPTPTQQRRLASQVGAARKAFNAMLGEVKATLEARQWERRILGGAVTEAQGWSLAALRRTWNANKDDWAPWWRQCSKEAFNTGLDSLARALGNWSASRTGTRAGARMGFPRFRKRGRGPQSVRFTTGAIRVEDDRHHVVLPRLGRIRTHESTRKLARRVEAGTARILSATVTRSASRWYVSFTVEVQRQLGRDGLPAHVGASRQPVVGVDLGVATVATVCAPDGTVVHEAPHPKALAAAQARLRRLGRKAARQHKGSNRWRCTQVRIAGCHARAANLRRDTLAKTTTRLAQRHDVIVIEDLNLAGMGRRKPGAGRGGRAFNRALRDGALAEVRRQLTYKCHWYGSALVVADRWYPSSKTCSACGERKPSLRLAERTYTCDACGLVIDRDRNAAVNLARLGENQQRPAGSGPVAGRGADHKTEPASAGSAGGDEASTPHDTNGADQKGTAPPQGKAA
ncbi:MAG: IS607 family element RNA-guided endonuclease TnpB [Acidimicrobiales bacterium]